MSDSGRQMGNCEHAFLREHCTKCIRKERDVLKKRLDDIVKTFCWCSNWDGLGCKDRGVDPCAGCALKAVAEGAWDDKVAEKV